MMLRQVSSRSQRGKGNLKLQNALQISLLVAICVWFLYQMEHSHDKNNSYLEVIKFKFDRSQFDIVKFSRKFGVRRHDHAVDGMSPSNEPDAVEEKDHEEASHKAREMNFKVDDASSGVVHVVVHEEEEEEHEGGSHEARERSFKADDASSAVSPHVPQANEPDLESGNGGMRNQSEKKPAGRPSAIADSSARRLPDSSEGEQKAKSVTFSKNQLMHEQKNSTAADIAAVQNKAAVAVPVELGDEKHNHEEGVTRKQKADIIGREEN